MPSVLFVCTANQVRSPIAAACFLKALETERAAESWIIESAGTWTKNGLPAAKITLQAARQLKIHGLHGHRTRQINQDLLSKFDLIIVMEKGHKEAISIEFPSVRKQLYLLSEVVDDAVYDIPDPQGQEVSASDVAQALLLSMIRGKEKIMCLARALSKIRHP